MPPKIRERRPTHTLLVPLYTRLGRVDLAQRIIAQRWERLNEIGEGASEEAIDLVRRHIELALKPSPVEEVRAYLNEATRMAPDDDRVWLGSRNLAIRTGAYDEAKRWLDDCLKSRPDETPVWRARLSWGLATKQVDVVQRAIAPASLRVDSGPGPSPAAWLFSERGDTDAERRELERLAATGPADPAALDRLAQLALKVASRNEPPSFPTRRLKSIASVLGTRSFTIGNNPSATRSRWQG